MRQLHPEAIAAIQSKALFSKAEEQLLSKVGSVSGQGTSWTNGKLPVWGVPSAPSVVCTHLQGPLLLFPVLWEGLGTGMG